MKTQQDMKNTVDKSYLVQEKINNAKILSNCIIGELDSYIYQRVVNKGKVDKDGQYKVWNGQYQQIKTVVSADDVAKTKKNLDHAYNNFSTNRYELRNKFNSYNVETVDGKLQYYYMSRGNKEMVRYIPNITVNDIGYNARGTPKALTLERARIMIEARDEIAKIFDEAFKNPDTTDYNTLLEKIENQLHTAVNSQNYFSLHHNKYQAIERVNSAGVTFFRGRVNNSSESIGKCFELIAFNRRQLGLPTMNEKEYVVDNSSCTIS